MKKKLFDLRLYLEGVKRLRIFGIAAAILTLTITILIPVYDLIDMSSVVFHENYPVQVLGDNQLAVPALVASYLMPVLAFVMFSYLNKRNESDFYHAFPYTRTCVYVSMMAALLSWVWGILAVSCLSAGLCWAINPYVTFSFGGLMEQMLYMCLNATLLVVFAAAACSLMGTFATSLIAYGVMLGSWRFALYIALLIFNDMNNLVRGADVLGGYLNPSFALPIGLIAYEANTLPVSVVVYAALVSLGMFWLGALFYKSRRSETAGRSVPGRWLQNAVRCLLCLPVALLLTYQIMGGTDGGTALIFVVILLLIFYLYELLTSKSVRSMLRATPWLAAVLGVCILLGGSVAVAHKAVMYENISADRIEAVGIDGTVGMSGLGLSYYERQVLTNYMTENDEAAAVVAKAYAQAQEAERAGRFYDETYGFPSTSSALIPNPMIRAEVNICLSSGVRVTRRILIERREYARLVEIIREESGVMPVPSREEVKDAWLYLLDQYLSIEVSGDEISHLLATMRQEWYGMNAEQKHTFASLDTGKAGDYLPILHLTVKLDGMRYTIGYNYCVDPEAMPQSYAILCDAMLKGQSSRDRAEEVLESMMDEDAEGTVSVQLQTQTGEKPDTYWNQELANYGEVMRFLHDHLDDMAGAGQSSDAIIVHVLCEMLVEDDGENEWYTSEHLALFLNLTEEECDKLEGLCQAASMGISAKS